MSLSRERFARRRAVVASLSAVGAALAAGSEARAGITVVNVNESIGFAAGDLPSTSVLLPGGATFTIETGTEASYRVIGLNYNPSPAGSFEVRALSYNSFYRPVRGNFGKTFFNVGGFLSNVVDIDVQTPKSSQHYSQGTFTDKYFLFSFNNAGTTDYGYIYGSETNSTYGGMNFNFISYAYDNTGAVIAAGAVPEPSSVALLGIGALVTGAAGVRRWKAAKAGSATV